MKSIKVAKYQILNHSSLDIRRDDYYLLRISITFDFRNKISSYNSLSKLGTYLLTYFQSRYKDEMFNFTHFRYKLLNTGIQDISTRIKVNITVMFDEFRLKNFVIAKFLLKKLSKS